jgi:hypothetical protein
MPWRGWWMVSPALILIAISLNFQVKAEGVNVIIE